MKEQPASTRSLSNYLTQHSFSGVFLLIGIVAVGIGAFLIQDINRAMAEAEQIYARSVRGLNLIGELQYQTQEARQNIIYALTATDEAVQSYHIDQSRQAVEQIHGLIREHRTLLREPEEVQANQRFEQDWLIFQAIRDDVINRILSKKIGEAIAIDLNQGVDSFNAVSSDLHHIKELYDTQAKRRLDDLSSAFYFSLLKVGALLALILVLVAGGVKYLERSKRLRAVQQSEERLEAVVESLNDNVFVIDRNGRVELANQAAEQRWSKPKETMFGIPLTELIPEMKTSELTDAINLCLTTRQNQTISQLRLNHPDQTARQYEVRFFPIENGATVIFNDITERLQAEDSRLRISKLESLGLLAGGIAHDFNNILTGVLGYISFAKLDLDTESPVYNRLGEAELAAIEAKHLTQQLLTFAKGGSPLKELTSLSELITEAATFVLHGSNVRCKWELPADMWSARVDTNQIKQVIHNLVINAIQAMPDGGTLTISGANIILGTFSQIKGQNLQPGYYVKITISDQGVGMTLDQMNSIFDPYFTTKPTGTGLGLTTAYTIINRHDGAITVQSAPGEGATFDIYLPAISEPVTQEESLAPTDAEAMHPGGRILIMDDEQIIRDLTARSLRQFGYEVHTVGLGSEAIEVYNQAMKTGEPFDLLIMDLTVPGDIGGMESMRHLREIDPNVRVLVSSGYHNSPVMAHYKDYGFSGVVLKPFRVQELLSSIERALRQAPRGQSPALQTSDPKKD